MPRLDRFLSAQLNLPRKSLHAMLASGRVVVDGSRATDMSHPVGTFTSVVVDSQVVQHQQPYYLMLNKPQGVVSATKDPHHRTVIDLLDHSFASQLHIVGRLDFNSTGLLLLTNDGTWSRQLSLPTSQLVKRYRVTVEQPITPEYIEAFKTGMYFGYEGITTKPAELTVVNDFCAEVGLTEGRYHQIKRMFGRFNNKVLGLHRIAVGPLVMDAALGLGTSRLLTQDEISLFSVPGAIANAD